ncbi:phage baseplate assembly protein [Shinella pollutisoli]|uniref:Phage baseplate assembly protein n=1 Tax=Shinella pollutisoli TaxID=2250594 RepID=A0ABV7DIG8_9HYPH|nr:Mu P family protein [Shinella pollutisoli]
MTGLTVSIGGGPFTAWTSCEVSRDMEDLSGSFTIELRDLRINAALPNSTYAAAILARPGMDATISADGAPVLVGYVDKVSTSIGEGEARVTITGRDKTGDLVDCDAIGDGKVAEFKNVKLEEAVKRISSPFGLSVNCEIDTGEPFQRYSIDLSETAHSAIEKGARSRHALILSDGIGGIVITRTGATRAPADLSLPGNVLSAEGEFDHSGRYSKTIVRGQSERASKERRAAPLDVTAEPVSVEDREPTDGSATERERKGTAATGIAEDGEITRYRPITHLARSKADQMSARDEADWRMRTARAKGEQLSYTVHGFGVGGRPWRINELTTVSDVYNGINRDMLISRVEMREDDGGRTTTLTVTSPEAFDKGSTGSRRANAPSRGTRRASSSGALDGTAERL